MKLSLLACSSAALVAGAMYLVPIAFAQNSPGMPGGIYGGGTAPATSAAKTFTIN